MDSVVDARAVVDEVFSFSTGDSAAFFELEFGDFYRGDTVTILRGGTRVAEVVMYPADVTTRNSRQMGRPFQALFKGFACEIGDVIEKLSSQPS